MMKFILYSVIVTFSIDLGTCYIIKNNATLKRERIIGGHRAKISEAPYQVALMDGDNLVCSGVLITMDHIITSAHCVDNYMDEDDAADLYVFAGVDNLTKNHLKLGDKRTIHKIVIHPDYDEQKLAADIAIIKLHDPFNKNDKIKPISLSQKPVEVGDTVMATGFGMINNTIQVNNSCLNKISYKIVDCGKVKFARTGDICAKSENVEGACNGDSGGPLINKDHELVGIVSRVEGSCANKNPDIYASVYYFRDFIHEIVDSGNNIEIDMGNVNIDRTDPISMIEDLISF